MLTLTLKSVIVRIEEARALQELISSVKDWQCQLSDILEPALVQHSDSPPVDVCSLLRALKVFSLQLYSRYFVFILVRAFAVLAQSIHAYELMFWALPHCPGPLHLAYELMSQIIPAPSALHATIDGCLVWNFVMVTVGSMRSWPVALVCLNCEGWS